MDLNKRKGKAMEINSLGTLGESLKDFPNYLEKITAQKKPLEPKYFRALKYSNLKSGNDAIERGDKSTGQGIIHQIELLEEMCVESDGTIDPDKLCVYLSHSFVEMSKGIPTLDKNDQEKALGFIIGIVACASCISNSIQIEGERNSDEK